MYCTNCGAYIRDEHRFCTSCGTNRPMTDDSPRGTRRVPLMITAALFLLGLTVYTIFEFGWLLP